MARKPPAQKVERVYGTANGARFAGVRFNNGQRVDVRIRGSSDGKLLNAWGDAHPTEETRRPRIIEMAKRQLVAENWMRDDATRAAKKGAGGPLENPALTIFANPGGKRARGQIVSRAVKEIWYVHAEDGKLYRHDFARGVTAEMLPDGSARIFRRDGKPLWKNF
jgi:hypothetical protein